MFNLAEIKQTINFNDVEYRIILRENLTIYTAFYKDCLRIELYDLIYNKGCIPYTTEKEEEQEFIQNLEWYLEKQWGRPIQKLGGNTLGARDAK